MNRVELKFLTGLNKYKTNSKLLIAVSGGVDSIVLLDILYKNKFNLMVAHCNFQLRREDSNKDEDFVRDFCAQKEIPIHVKKFEVDVYKETANYSTQMAARALRYQWFKELLEQEKFDALVTAHHLDDNIETFLINLSRGTGIKGLCGIGSDKNKMLRPLLHITKKEILSYAKENRLEWREDSSNADDYYIRNKIRHHILPVLRELHPHFDGNFEKTLSFLKETQNIVEQTFIDKREELFIKKEDGFEIEISQLKKLEPFETYCYELFHSFGFSQVQELVKFINLSSTGKEIQSETYRLIHNRDKLLLYPLSTNSTSLIFYINIFEGVNIITKPLHLSFEKSEKIDKNATETVDFHSLQLPLQLRKTKTSDIFYPLGMKGAKKLSKYFKDEKLSKLQKENTWLLCNADDEIIWVVGHRLDRRFKMKDDSRTYLNMTLC